VGKISTAYEATLVFSEAGGGDSRRDWLWTWSTSEIFFGSTLKKIRGAIKNNYAEIL
jgi:hypothetical protein